jgi:DNA-binding transcriptional LysR family regulator
MMDRIEVLRAYVRLVERGSFTAVAEELGIGQSTVSKWLAGLEEELGVQLLDRTTRSQRVTDAGQRFYEHAVELVNDFDVAVADVREQATTLRGRIRLSLPVVFGQRYVVPLLARFLRSHKEVELEMVYNDRYVSLIDEGYDLAIRVGVPIDSSLRSHRLGESRRRVVASPGYVKLHGAPRSPRELADHECLVHTRLSGRTTWSFRHRGKSHRVTVHGRVSVNNSEATLALARSGLGICMLASWLVDTEIRAGRLVPLLDGYQPPDAPIRALTAPTRRIPPRVRALLDHLRTGLERSLLSEAA